MTTPFWKSTPLDRLTQEQWESLCDGCAKCCLLKLEDEDTGEVAFTRLHCRLLDAGTCRCSNYANRRSEVPDCVQLTAANVTALSWMPSSCAYRLVAEGKDLPPWHHLICGDRARIHREGHSIFGRTVAEDAVFNEDPQDWIVDWDGNPP